MLHYPVLDSVWKIEIQEPFIDGNKNHLENILKDLISSDKRPSVEMLLTSKRPRDWEFSNDEIFANTINKLLNIGFDKDLISNKIAPGKEAHDRKIIFHTNEAGDEISYEYVLTNSLNSLFDNAVDFYLFLTKIDDEI